MFLPICIGNKKTRNSFFSIKKKLPAFFFWPYLIHNHLIKLDRNTINASNWIKHSNLRHETKIRRERSHYKKKGIYPHFAFNQ